MRLDGIFLAVLKAPEKKKKKKKVKLPFLTVIHRPCFEHFNLETRLATKKQDKLTSGSTTLIMRLESLHHVKRSCAEESAISAS